MNDTFFAKKLARRMRVGLGVTFVVAGTLAGCGAKVVVDQKGAGGSGGAGVGGQTTSTGTSSSSSGTMTCGGLGQLQVFFACVEPGADGCPSKEDAVGPLQVAYDFGCTCQLQDLCFCLDSMIDGPKPDPDGNGLCCYDTMIELVCVI